MWHQAAGYNANNIPIIPTFVFKKHFMKVMVVFILSDWFPDTGKLDIS